MNRRDFLKFLGRATVVSGVAVVAGLPEVPEGISTTIGLDKYVDDGLVVNWADSWFADEDGVLWVTQDDGLTWAISQIP